GPGLANLQEDVHERPRLLGGELLVAHAHHRVDDAALEERRLRRERLLPDELAVDVYGLPVLAVRVVDVRELLEHRAAVLLAADLRERGAGLRGIAEVR